MATATQKKPVASATKAGMKDTPIINGVGFIAGDIHDHLTRHGEASLNDLKQELGQTPAMLQMAVGWLAREDKVQISKKGAGYMIRLNH